MTPCAMCRDTDELCPDCAGPRADDARPTVAFTRAPDHAFNARAIVDMMAPLTGVTWDEINAMDTTPRHPLLRRPWPDSAPTPFDGADEARAIVVAFLGSSLPTLTPLLGERLARSVLATLDVAARGWRR